MSEKKSNDQNDSDSLDFLFSNWKRIASIFSALLSFCGIICILVVGFIVNDALTKTQNSINSNFDSALGIVGTLESSVSSLSSQLNKTNTTLSDLESSISPLSTGVNSASDSISSLSNSLRSISLPGFNFGNSATLLQNSASSLRESASSFNRTATDLRELKAGFSDFEQSFSLLKTEVSLFKEKATQTKSSIFSFFDSLKTANLLFVLCFVILFSAQIANSLIYLF